MQISVVIPCHGGAALTRACLDSLLAQAGDHELQVVLVDNARDPATAALAGHALRPTVLEQPRNLGFAGACNQGLAVATMPFAAVLNNDTQAAPHLLTRLHAALLHDERIAFAAPVSNRVKGPAAIACGDAGRTAEGRAQVERELCDPSLGCIEDADTLSGLCLLGRLETWRQLQGFDDRFVPGNFEDDDLCLRARLRGHRLVIARDAFLHHEAHQTFRALGITVQDEVLRQHAVFRAKWQRDPAGEALLCTLANDHAGAAEAALRARRLYPDWADADWIVGRQLAEQRRHAEAIPFLQAWLRQCPCHLDGIVLLGTAWLATGAARPARELWRWAMAKCAFQPAQAGALLTCIGDHAQRSGDLDQAAAHFRMALEVAPDDGALCNRLGGLLIELRRFDEAVPVLERAAELGLALAHTNLGICHYHAGAPARALEHFARAAEQLPNDATVQQNYARALAAAPRAN